MVSKHPSDSQLMIQLHKLYYNLNSFQCIMLIGVGGTVEQSGLIISSLLILSILSSIQVLYLAVDLFHPMKINTGK